MKWKIIIIASVLWVSLGYTESSLIPKQMIYCQGRDGNLFTIGGGSMEKCTLSNHAPLAIPTFKVSPDFRYILYGGTDKTIGCQKLFLYDLQTKTEHLVLETPKYDTVKEEFSPDSKTLVLMNVSSPHRQALKNEGLFIIDLQTLEQRFFPYPNNTQIPQSKVIGSEVKWSQNGRSIYLAFNGWVKGLTKKTHLREYHRFDLAEEKFYKADGYYGGDLESSQNIPSIYVFTDQNGAIPLHNNNLPKSQTRNQKTISPDGRWIAEIKNLRNLIISEKDGSKRIVEETKRCSCGACTIGIIAWLDDGQLLIYRTDKLGYCIYNPTTKEKNVLFKTSDVNVFTWP
jgi:WD40 repeat protein